MNNNFNFGRFGKYFVHDLLGQWRNIGMLMLICALFPFIFYVLYMVFSIVFGGDAVDVFTKGVEVDGPSLLTRTIVFGFVAAVFTIVFPSRAYGEITDKAKGREWLMLPASRLEKFTSMMLVSIVVIPIVFFTAYLASDFLVCLFDGSCGKSILSCRFYDTFGDSDFVISINGFLIIVATVVEWVSIFLLGGLIFKKWKVVGTFIVNSAIGMLFIIVLGIFAPSMAEWIEECFESWVMRNACYLDIWLNGFINFWLFLIVAVCGTLSWFRIKRLQH